MEPLLLCSERAEVTWTPTLYAPWRGVQGLSLWAGDLGKTQDLLCRSWLQNTSLDELEERP